MKRNGVTTFLETVMTDAYIANMSKEETKLDFKGFDCAT